MKYAVCVVRPPGYGYSDCFNEVAETLHHGLLDLGHDSILTDELWQGNRRPIVLGSNLLTHGATHPSANAILYNLEQIDPGSPWLTPHLLNVFSRHEVWDYSPRNASLYWTLGLKTPRVVPLAYHPMLSRIEKGKEDIDVLFYGSMNTRRQELLRSIAAKGLEVKVAPDRTFGKELDALIARSRVVLNCHFYEAKVFELTRVSYLLANRKAVVSESGLDLEMEMPFASGVSFAAYAEIPARCVYLVRSDYERKKLEDEGFRLMSAIPASEVLREALDPVPSYFRHARPDVVEFLKPQGKRILDVGCGAGLAGQAMLTAGAAEVVGVEMDDRASVEAMYRVGSVFQGDIDDEDVRKPLAIIAKFDSIVCADVLEHLRDPVETLTFLRSLLKPGGELICSFPNVRHESVLLPLLAMGQWEYQTAGILDRTHLRFGTVMTWLRVLGEAGFCVKEGDIGAVTTKNPPRASVEQAVKSLGGDVERYRMESSVMQYLVRARKVNHLEVDA